MQLSKLLLASLVATPLLAQSGPTLHSAADLAKLEAKLTASAKTSPTGFSMDTIDDFGSARTLYIVRVHTGDAELHEGWADQMVITKGSVILVTGGNIQGGHGLPTNPARLAGPRSKAVKRSPSTPATPFTSPQEYPTGSKSHPAQRPPTSSSKKK